MYQLRDYQTDSTNKVETKWLGGANNVLLTLPTGGGKTVIFTHVAKTWDGYVCIIAHRQELIIQTSLTLAQFGVYHRIITSNNSTIKAATFLHMQECGKCYIDQNARVGVAGVRTLLRRNDPFLKKVTLWIQDEAHHIQKDNEWGKAILKFPNARRGLGVTATPCRADGRGLGYKNDGVFHSLVVGLSGRELIDRGFLSPYKIYVPKQTLDLSGVNLSKDGDFNRQKLAKAVKKSKIIGDIPKDYMLRGANKLGITFMPSIELAEDCTEKFNQMGVTSITLSSRNSDQERINALKKFKNREILQLLNVDLFGEGFDLPSLEVVSFGRPTMSYSLYSQQFGRSLRIMKGKDHATIIDHTGNVIKHGLPDLPREWSLERREKTSSGNTDAIPLKVCPSCTQPYERIYKGCPLCGYYSPPAERGSPEIVDGDLTELDPSVIARLHGNISLVDRNIEDFERDLRLKGCPHKGILGNVNKHIRRQTAQSHLRNAISWWAAFKQKEGYTDSQIYRYFYLNFGVDIMTAQALKANDAYSLTGKIWGSV